MKVVTPENIAFEYRLAGPFARIGAYAIDQLIIAGVFLLAAFVFGSVSAALALPGLGAFAVLVSLFLLYWFYGGLFEWLMSGQTPGKRMTQLRVLRTDGRPITARQAVMRNLLRLIDLYPYCYVLPDVFNEDVSIPLPTGLVCLAAMAFSRRYQRVGDLACSTMVVAEEPSGSGRAAKDWLATGETANDPQLQRVLAALPASYRPSRTLARALSHYASRRRYLGPGRRREIARHVGAPLAEQLGLPPDTDHDLLLGALYVRTFLNESDEEAMASGPEKPPVVGANPVLAPAPPAESTDPTAAETAPPAPPPTVGVAPGAPGYQIATTPPPNTPS